MTGNCISGHHDHGHYYLTNNKEEAAIYRKNMEYLLQKANPLMDIYREEQKEVLYKFLDSEAEYVGKRRRILASPPLFVIPVHLLKKILERNHISPKEQQQLLEYQKVLKGRVEKILSHSVIADELPVVSESEYANHPSILSVTEHFLEKDILLSYEEYCQCIKESRKYEQLHENYHFRLAKVKGFRNIQITCFEGKWCMVSKNKAPAIHFVIHHPKLRYALENVRLPIIDEPTVEMQDNTVLQGT